MREEYDIENLNPRKLAWDPDFTKLTLAEKKELEEADAEIRNGETVSHEEINWD